jgi:hypothetical protein
MRRISIIMTRREAGLVAGGPEQINQDTDQYEDAIDCDHH